MGVPGCPEFAACTASMESVRMVLILSRSRFGSLTLAPSADHGECFQVPASFRCASAMDGQKIFYVREKLKMLQKSPAMQARQKKTAHRIIRLKE